MSNNNSTSKHSSKHASIATQTGAVNNYTKKDSSVFLHLATKDNIASMEHQIAELSDGFKKELTLTNSAIAVALEKMDKLFVLDNKIAHNSAKNMLCIFQNYDYCHHQYVVFTDWLTGKYQKCVNDFVHNYAAKGSCHLPEVTFTGDHIEL